MTIRYCDFCKEPIRQRRIPVAVGEGTAHIQTFDACETCAAKVTNAGTTGQWQRAEQR